MIVLRTLKDAQLFNHLSAERVFGKHSLDGFVNRKITPFRHQLAVGYFFETADVTGVITVILVFVFFAREDRLIAVDNDHEIPRIYVGRKGGFVLPSQNGSHLGSESSERDPRRVYDVPFLSTVSA